MKHLTAEAGRTLRYALVTWPRTLRLLLVMVVICTLLMAVAATWTLFELPTSVRPVLLSPADVK